MQRLIGFFRPDPGGTSSANTWLRVAVAWVFITSGAVKFAFANQGVGRFMRIGLPAPAALASGVGAIEIVGGALLAVGLLTRLAAVPLCVDMVVAIAATKLPLLFGAGPEPIAAPPRMGLWAFAYQARLDLLVFAVCAYLVVTGAGAWSIDAWLAQRRGAGRLHEAAAQGAT